MNYFFRLLQYLLMGFCAFMTSCKPCSLGEFIPTQTKKILLVADYEQEWEYPTTEGTDWKHFSSWEETFQLSYELLRPEKPEGLRVQLHLDYEQPRVYNLEAQGGEIPFSDLNQSVLLYNNNTEYIVFDELQSLNLAMASTRTRSRDKGQQKKVTEETMNAPDMLYSHFIESYVGSEHEDVEVMSVVLKPLVFSYLIQVEFDKGLEHIETVRGSLSGMADAVLLSEGRTSTKAATLLFDFTLRDFAIQALVRSFGNPSNPDTRFGYQQGIHLMKLEVKLKNGKKQFFEFDVSDQVNKQPQGGVIRVQHVELSDDILNSSRDSGFDVNVTDWEDFEKVPLPI